MAGRPRLDLHQKVREILSHTTPLPPESVSPILHYEKSTNDGVLLLDYLENHIDVSVVYKSVLDRHLLHLHRMLLANFIETFERLLKELAAVCVDQVVEFVADGRYDKFTANGEQIAAHFGARSIGRALCEADTWLNNKDINERFRNLLKLPFMKPSDFLFPNVDQHPASERERAKTLAILWQVRHNLTHNSGVLTGSDAAKLRMLSRTEVGADRLLTPTRIDLRYVHKFLADTADYANRWVGGKLALLLTEIHRQNSTVFDNQAKADEISRIFHLSLEIDGAKGVS